MPLTSVPASERFFVNATSAVWRVCSFFSFYNVSQTSRRRVGKRIPFFLSTGGQDGETIPSCYPFSCYKKKGFLPNLEATSGGNITECKNTERSGQTNSNPHVFPSVMTAILGLSSSKCVVLCAGSVSRQQYTLFMLSHR